LEITGTLWWLAQNTAIAGVLAAFVALVCGLARPRPAVRHALWLVVLVKLLAPPLISWPWSAWDVGRPLFQRFIPDEPPIAQNARSDKISVHLNPPPLQSEPEIVLIPVDVQEEPPATVTELLPEKKSNQNSGPVNLGENTEQLKEVQGPPSVSITSLGVKLWLVGAFGVGLWQTWRIARFRRRLTKALTPPEWLTGEVAELAAQLHIRTPCISVMAGITSPLIWTLGAPVVVWPAELSQVLSGTSRRCVLLHELAHLRRRDHWVSWLELLGSCVYWWNPLFWFVVRQVRENAELACDAWVVDTLPDARRAFAEALIEVAQVMSTKEAPVPALGLGAGRRRDFERRLLMIMSTGIPCQLPWRGLVVVGLFALAALPGWSPGQQETEKPKAPAPVAVPPPAPVTPAPSVVDPSIAEVAPPAAIATDSGAVTNVTNVAATAVGDPDARLKAIEDQLQALLKEVRGMRKGGAQKATATAVSAPQYFPPPTVSAVPSTAPVAGQVAFPPPVSRPDGAINLTRAVYDLPAAKAKALTDLLQDSKGPVVEIKAEGDKVTVTTTPDAQQIVGQLIAMLQGKTHRSVTRYQYQAVPVTTYEAAPATR
jgi:beta-lactamase regulating signal transducer with metallopeptidase domain